MTRTRIATISNIAAFNTALSTKVAPRQKQQLEQPPSDLPLAHGKQYRKQSRREIERRFKQMEKRNEKATT